MFGGLALIVAGFVATFLGTSYVFALGMAWLGHELGLRGSFGLVFAVTAACTLLMWWPFVARMKQDPSRGIRLARDDEPGFVRWVNGVGSSQGRRAYDVHLTLEPTFTLHERHGHYLIGLPYVLGLSQVELGAVIVSVVHDRTGVAARLQDVLEWMRRSLAHMLREGTQYSPLHWPLKLYASFFELVAGHLVRAHAAALEAAVARAVGGSVAVSAFQRFRRVESRHDVYMRSDVLSVAALGFIPPLVAGWDQFERGPLAIACDPPLERDQPHWEQLRAVPAALALSTESARLLFDDLERCVRRMLERFGERPLEPIGWDEVAARCYLPYLQQFRGAASAAFDGPMGTWRHEADGEPSDEAPPRSALEHAAIILALADAGWSVDIVPGDHVRLACGVHATTIDELTQALGNPILWENTCHALGIAELELRGAGAVHDVVSTSDASSVSEA